MELIIGKIDLLLFAKLYWIGVVIACGLVILFVNIKNWIPITEPERSARAYVPLIDEGIDCILRNGIEIQIKTIKTLRDPRWFQIFR